MYAELLNAHPRPTRIARLRTFYLQYISLMLIVITFVIGSFVTHAVSKPSPAIVPQIKSEPQQTKNLKSISEMVFSDIFEPSSSVLKADQLSAMTELLLNHDLSAKIWVRASDVAFDADSKAALALARSVSVYKYLIERGVPDSALSVIASEGGGPIFRAQIIREED